MTGETNLQKIISQLNPILSEDRYVFVHTTQKPQVLKDSIFAFIQEPEGWTLISTRKDADRFGYSYDQVFRRISLSVHSSLEAVGLTALVSGELAKASIPCNIIAGYFHDHIFVPENQAGQAIEMLKSISQ